jgi:glycosyltransferase involved in cell wall biosynthesis
LGAEPGCARAAHPIRWERCRTCVAQRSEVNSHPRSMAALPRASSIAMCFICLGDTRELMRIAIVTEVFLPAVDGVVTRLRHTISELANAGDEVLVAAPAGGPAEYGGAHIAHMPAVPMPLYPDGQGYPDKRVSLPTPALGRALRAFKPDLIHAINPLLLAAGGVYYARRLRLPLVASYHANMPAYSHYYGIGWLERPGWRYVRSLHNRADLNLCTSRATMETLRQHRVERIALWPYGIEADLNGCANASRAWRERLSGGHPERHILLFVGRLAKEKEVSELVAAVRGVDGVALAIVGDGPLRSHLEAEFAGTPTTFLGILRGQDLASAYASADMFVFPSRTETLGLVLLEAHAAGLPIVAADSAAARDLVRHGVDGLWYDPSRPRALAEAVSRVAGDPDLAQSMSNAARAAVAGASWREATRVLRGYYETVCSQAGGGSAITWPDRDEMAIPAAVADSVSGDPDPGSIAADVPRNSRPLVG